MKLSLGERKVKAPTAFTLSLPPTPIFSPSTLICVLVSLSLLMGRREEETKPNSKQLWAARALYASSALPRLARVPLIHLSRGTTQMHSEGGRRFCTIVQGGPTEWRPELELIIILCFVPQMLLLFTLLLLKPCLFCFCLQILSNGSALSFFFSSAWGLAVSREGLGRSEIVV